MAQGRDLAKCLGKNSVALMRGMALRRRPRSLIEVVRLSVYLPRNARALMRAKMLGGKIKYLSKGEMDARNKATAPTRPRPGAPGNTGPTRPASEHLLTRPDGGPVHGGKHDHDHNKARIANSE